MSSQNKNSPLWQQLGNSQNPYGDAALGVEVELEGSLYGSSSRNKYWLVKGEGSLRNGGMEYVFKSPVSLDILPKALDEFDLLMKNSKPVCSIRCSTHIHVSVLDFTTAQIYNAMLAWYFVEDLFMATQSVNRQGNLFCLPLSRAEEIAVSIKDSMTNSDGFYTFHVERNRYAALNLCAITKFGSFEFRFLDAMTSGKEIDRWCRILYRVVNNTKNISPETLLEMYEQMSAVTFLSHLIGSEYVQYIIKGLSTSQVTRYLHSNYDHIFEFAHMIKKQKFQLPRTYWNEDLEGPGKLNFSTSFSDMSTEEQMALVAGLQGAPAQPVWAPFPPPPPGAMNALGIAAAGGVYIDQPVPAEPAEPVNPFFHLEEDDDDDLDYGPEEDPEF